MEYEYGTRPPKTEFVVPSLVLLPMNKICCSRYYRASILLLAVPFLICCRAFSSSGNVAEPLQKRRTLRHLVGNNADLPNKAEASRITNRRLGSFFTPHFPTGERVSRWIGSDETTRQRHRAKSFNHASVGMTTPPLDFSTTSTMCFDRDDGDDGELSRHWPGIDGSRIDSSWRMVRCESPHGMNSDFIALLQLRFRRYVGNGDECYRRCQAAALTWEFQAEHMGIVAPGQPMPSNADYAGGRINANVDTTVTTRSGRSLVTYSQRKIGRWKLYVVNPVHVVYDMIDAKPSSSNTTLDYFTSTAYATGRGHWIRGEERVSVCYRNNGDVDVEIISVSQSARSIMGYLVWPFLGSMQKRFFLDQIRHFQSVGAVVEDE